MVVLSKESLLLRVQGKEKPEIKRTIFGEEVHLDPTGSDAAKLSPLPQPEEVKLIEPEVEQNKQTYPVAVANSAAVPAQVALQAIRHQLNTDARFAGKSKEEVAAIKIQAAFRAYLAKRALRALRGMARLKSLMEGPAARRQAAGSLRCMQTLFMQCQIHAWRTRMMEENQALQRQLLQKHAKEIVNLQMGEDWDDSVRSKEQIEASLLSKHEAAMRRERAMAYSFTHQQTWKNASRSMNPLFMDPSNPSWGWSWMERWMTARPWEVRGGMRDKEHLDDHSSLKSARSNFGGEISKAYARYQLNLDKQSPKANQKPSRTSSLLSPSTPKSASIPARKLKSASPRSGVAGLDDETRSIVSMKSDRNRRHSIAGSSVRDNESLANSLSLPCYMVPTKSARAKTSLQSPLGPEANGTPEKEPIASTKKRLSYPPSPARLRRHSGLPKVDGSISNTKVAVVNGGDGFFK
ncbi:hypothetical protein CXB51_003022 [Gossypium anomalum]|uniref:Protein IQ-DOMAIN 1-like n=1 Tax=Gossypium anomalum TaxID=47600 RepID=A0A8J5ZF87_9ROSI|nr:hypothetical protein CXB51_003022 [Gossypium anomalum]